MIKDNVIRIWHEKRPDIKTIAELERRIGLSNGTIGKWSSKTPSTKSLLKVAQFFHVELSEILGNSNTLDEEFAKYARGMNHDQKQKFAKALIDFMPIASKLIKDGD